MPLPWMQIYGALPAFLLVLARVAGIVIAAPFFSAAAIPARIKALLVVAMAVAVFPLVNEHAHVAVPVNLVTAVGGLAGEFALGWLIGFSVAVILMGVQLGIQLASQQAGMALGEVFNPMLESSLPVVSQLYFFVSVMVFLGVHGHHALVRSLLDSFDTVPLLGFAMSVAGLDDARVRVADDAPVEHPDDRLSDQDRRGVDHDGSDGDVAGGGGIGCDHTGAGRRPGGAGLAGAVGRPAGRESRTPWRIPHKTGRNPQPRDVARKRVSAARSPRAPTWRRQWSCSVR